MFRGKVQIYSRCRERWMVCEKRDRRFVPWERFPKFGDPALRNSSSNGRHPRTDSRQRSASLRLPNFEPLKRTLVAHVLPARRRMYATARLLRSEPTTKTTAVGLRLLSYHKKDDKNCRQVSSMIQSRIAKAHWASSGNSPYPCAEAMKGWNGSLPLGSRRSSGSLRRHLRGSLHRHPHRRGTPRSRLRGIPRPRVVQMRGSLWTQTELLC
jgi:hypothetical protein